MSDDKRTERPSKPREQTVREPNADYTQYFEGDGATGANKAYGNTPGNTGARFDAQEP